MEDPKEAILIHRKVLALCPPGHPQRPAFLDSITSSLRIRFDRIEHLDEAIPAHRKALSLLPLGHPHRSATLGNLVSRFRQFHRYHFFSIRFSPYSEPY
jgi:hypothetical protein